ncbi:metallophosphatase [Mesonia aestuariivivens]|uniref:Metallophosphatase n=1 Tax=Mesonia aestuariivivens TaxID=2796128 RepID=A0ABS6W5N6_9FLAO|nr:metallophosphatase [Mesonia aestuariivivens]MBW2962837.1 metallophosphatase [Mesonia aestuariivivens]
MKKLHLFKWLFTLVVLGSYISVSAQTENDKEISKTLFITANTGFNKNSASKEVLNAITKASQDATNASFLLVGNLTPKGGFPQRGEEKKRDEVKKYLTEELLNPLKDFNGKLILGPGVNEWNKTGHENIDDMESFLQDNSNSDFWPNDGCASKSKTLNDDVELVMVDSQWFLEDWDNHPYINNKCEIKTRSQFFAEFKDDIKDAQGKTVIVVVHHPIMSNTKQGFFGKMGGFGSQAFYGAKRQELAGRLETLASQFEDVIFVSGNDENLQYLKDDAIPQIISGTGLKKTKNTRKPDEGHFASSEVGYAKLIVYKDGSSKVEFFKVANQDSEKIGENIIKRQRISIDEVTYHTKDEFGDTYKASVYTDKETDKSKLYKWFWGDHYRDVYQKKIEVPVLWIDTIAGNPKGMREGGGHQSRSVRIKGDDEHEYTLREVKKSALRFIQSFIKDHYIYNYMNETLAEDLVQDFYTTAHPFAPFAVGDMFTAVDINYSQPDIYYLPKQKNLGIYNEDYGDKLYMLEAHAGDENKDFERFGNADDILSTSDMLLEIREGRTKVKIDEDVFIRARLMDMLFGDWDRHSDQWRWAEFEQEDGSKLYKSIPRDRDQDFPKYDGIAIKLLKLGITDLRPMQSYGPDVKNVKWLNRDGSHLDKALINKANWKDWKNQAEFIQNNLTDQTIDKAFASLPKDTQDETIAQIKKDLKLRRDNLIDITKRYYTYLKKYETLIGSEDDDEFLITRKPDGVTQIQITNEDGKLVFDNEYLKDETNEIWIYGLDGEDTFKIEGEGDHYIRLNILGGENNDIYDFANTRKTKIYDYKSKKNTIKNARKTWLVDSYDVNTYDPEKKKINENVVLPSIAFNPDAGFQIGVRDTYTKYGLTNNPYSSQHTFDARYYSATTGFSFDYSGEFAHFFYNWNFGLDARFTSANYAINYFGAGNRTTYNEDDVTMDYNRVKIGQWSVAPSLIWRDKIGYKFYVKPSIESYDVKYNDNQVTGLEFNANDPVFNNQLYAGAEVGFQFKNKPGQLAFIRRGMEFGIVGGYKTNIDDNDNKFGYIEPTISFDYPLHESGLAVLATKIQGKAIIGDDYEFYHGATIGGNTSLRGFRYQRFNGKYSFFQSSDLRVGVAKFRTNFIPLRLGVTAGFDYGRVWEENDDSDRWHNSYGGSVFLNGFQAFTGNLGFYHSKDGNRIVFTLGFKY